VRQPQACLDFLQHLNPGGLMYVYFIKAHGKPPRMKIGKANDVEARLAGLKTGCPYKLSLMAKIKCRSEKHAFQVEKLAHEFFKEHRAYGEWFRCTDFIISKAWEFEGIALSACKQQT
jgi:hypothetical protein